MEVQHSWASKKGSTFVKKSFKCDPHRVPATKIEQAVLENIKELIETPKLTEWIVKKAKEIHLQKGVNFLKLFQQAFFTNKWKS